MDSDPIPKGQTLFTSVVTVHFDGACEPAHGGGVATYGFTISGASLEYEEKGLAVPPWSARATNNVAEYVAAIRALEWLRSKGFDGVVVLIGDSQLVIRQMSGEYEVKADHLKAYHGRLSELTEQFGEVRPTWVRREDNARADELSKEALQENWESALKMRPRSSS